MISAACGLDRKIEQGPIERLNRKEMARKMKVLEIDNRQKRIGKI